MYTEGDDWTAARAAAPPYAHPQSRCQRLIAGTARIDAATGYAKLIHVELTAAFKSVGMFYS
jgi:hypothetical protein